MSSVPLPSLVSSISSIRWNRNLARDGFSSDIGFPPLDGQITVRGVIYVTESPGEHPRLINESNP